MAVENYKTIETDLLVVGGGTAGAPLAAKAAESGLDVTILEKSNIARSGNIAHGVDSYGIFPHGVNVRDLLPMYYERMTSVFQGPGRWCDENIDYVIFSKAWWAVEELERMGIPMKWDDGEYYWTPHMIHRNGLKLGLRVHWHDVKPKMAKMCADRGVHTLNRTMLIDIMTDNGRATGATAFDTRTGEFMVIKAKAVAICSGMYCRMYQPETALIWKYQMRYHYCPASCSGDGWAAAYRAGAGLAHLDDASWAIRIRDDITCSQGNFSNNDGITSRQVYWDGTPASPYHAHSYKGAREAEDLAKVPVYHTFEHLPDDWIQRMELNYLDERMVSLKLAADRGFNPRNHWYEMTSYKPLQMMMIHGIQVDEHFESPFLKGLYAAGDAAAGVGGAYGACTSGLIIGDEIKAAIDKTAAPVIHADQIQASYDRAFGPTMVEDGTEPLELEVSLRHIAEKYIGALQNEGKILEGLRRFDSIKREFLPELMAKTPHEMMRALETRNTMQLLELHLIDSLKRRETRNNHVRLDYPEMDDTRTNFVTINRMENGEDIYERIEEPTLKPEYAEALKDGGVMI